MSYGVSVSWQVSNFFMSMGLGFFIGLIYDVVLSTATAFSHAKLVYIISDLFFSIVSTFLFFCYTLIYCQGETRLNSIVASLIGAFVFHFTVGKIIGKFLNRVDSFIKKIIHIAFFPLIAIMTCIKSKLKIILNKIKEAKKLDKNTKKSKNENIIVNKLRQKQVNLKKRLQKSKKEL